MKNDGIERPISRPHINDEYYAEILAWGLIFTPHQEG